MTLDAFPGRSFRGVIRRVAPFVLDVEKQARTVDVEVEADGSTGETATLLPGYSADVELLIRSRPHVLRVPTEAVLQENRVLVYRDGVLAEKQIVTGVSNWEYTEVVSGLERGELVVLSVAREGVRDGAAASSSSRPSRISPSI